MTYTKTALNKFKKEQIIALYIEDQKKWIQDSKEHDEAVKQLLIQKAQAENSYKLLSDKYQVDLRESSGGYRAKINRLEKEIEELKSRVNSNSPNNLTLIKNLKVANAHLKKEVKYLINLPYENTEIFKENHSLNQQKQKMKDHWDGREKRLDELHQEKLSIKKELTDQNTQYRMDIDKLKEELNLCKASHKRLTEKINSLKQKEEKRDKLIAELSQIN